MTIVWRDFRSHNLSGEEKPATTYAATLQHPPPGSGFIIIEYEIRNNDGAVL